MSHELKFSDAVMPNKHQKKLTIFYFVFGILLYLSVYFFPGGHWGDIVEALRPYLGGMKESEDVNRFFGLNPLPAQIMIAYVFFFWIIFVLCWAFVLIGNVTLQNNYVEHFLSGRQNKSAFSNILYAAMGCVSGLTMPLIYYLADGVGDGIIGTSNFLIFSSSILSVGFFQLVGVWFSSAMFAFYFLLLLRFTFSRFFKLL